MKLLYFFPLIIALVAGSVVSAAHAEVKWQHEAEHMKISMEQSHGDHHAVSQQSKKQDSQQPLCEAVCHAPALSFLHSFDTIKSVSLMDLTQPVSHSDTVISWLSAVPDQPPRLS